MTQSLPPEAAPPVTPGPLSVREQLVSMAVADAVAAIERAERLTAEVNRLEVDLVRAIEGYKVAAKDLESKAGAALVAKLELRSDEATAGAERRLREAVLAAVDQGWHSAHQVAMQKEKAHGWALLSAAAAGGLLVGGLAWLLR